MYVLMLLKCMFSIIAPMTLCHVRSVCLLKNPQAKNLWVYMSGKFPMDLGIPPLEIQNLTETNPLKSRSLVCGLTVWLVAYNIQHANSNLPHATHGIEHATCNISTWHTSYMMRIILHIKYSLKPMTYANWHLTLHIIFIGWGTRHGVYQMW